MIQQRQQRGRQSKTHASPAPSPSRDAHTGSAHVRAALLTAFAGAVLMSSGCGGALSLTGIVRDDAGDPVSGATVSVRAVDATEEAVAFGTIEVVTDSDGTYVAPGLATGNYEIASYQSGYADAPAQQKLVVPDSATADLVLRKKINFSGIVYADGEPVEQATVMITRDGSTVEDRTTDSKGKFSVANFYRGDGFSITLRWGRRVLGLSDQRVTSEVELVFNLPEEDAPRSYDSELVDRLNQDPNTRQDNP